MPTLNSSAFSVIVNRDTSSSMTSNNFTITVNRPTSSPSLGETVVKVSKRGVPLVGTNNTSPSDGYFCFTIIKTDGCRVTKSGVDSLRVDSIEEDVGTVTLNINAENKSNYTKVITVLKANQGVVGEDGYTVILTNEAHTFLGDETKAIGGSTNCGVIVYKGSTRVSATIGTPTGVPNGMTISINNNGTINASMTITVTSSMTKTNGEVSIPITVNNRTFNKTFTYSLALKGTHGSDAKFLGLSADRQVVAFDSNGRVKDDTAITLTATQQNFSDTITWTTSPNITLTGSGNTRQIATSSFDSNDYIKVTVTSGTLSDSMTLVKVVDGTNGMDGVPGNPGENGITYYTWIRYADDENGTNISNNPTGKNYIGLAYNKTTSVESNDPLDYNWFKIVGEKGDTGEAGEPGADGITHYTWIKYSDYADGTGLYDTPNDGTKYIGIAVNRLTTSESSNKEDYVWSKFKGEDGKDGTSITILGSYDSEEALNNAHPDNNTMGDCYIVNGDLYVWTGEAFNNVGNIKGEDGRTSYFHVKYSNDGGLTFTSNNGEDVGLYMGTYVNFIESDSNNVDDYTWVLIKGEQGVNGADGVDGKDGTSIVWKGTFDKNPNNPKDGWAYKNSTDKKSYVYQDGAWYQMTIDGADGIDGNDGLSIEYQGELASPPTSPIKNWAYKDADNGTVYIYTGTAWEVLTYDGDNGQDGAKGQDGLSIFVTYHDSEVKPNTPTGNGTSNGWHTNCTDAVVWMSQKVAMTSTEGTWGTPVKIKGQDGKDGTSVTILGTYNSLDELNAAHGSGNNNGDGYIIQGDLYVWDGTQFLNVGNINGESSYVHIKYSNDGGRTFTSNDGEDVGDYMGVYVDSTISDSMNPEDYKWSKIKGEQGEQGIQGVPGKDGQTTYFHIKYSSNANGNPMTETPSTYIGTYVDYTREDSTDYTKYTWARFQGLQGAKGDQGIPGTNGTDGQTYYLHIKYSNDGGKTFTSNNGENTGDYIGVYTDTTQADSTSVSKYTWSKIKGEQGEQGVPGNDGKDGEKGQSLVSSVPQWYLSTSSTTQTGGSWVETMPQLTSNKYLWLRYKLTWENPSSITYTTPTLEQVAESMKDVVSKQSQLEQTMDGFKMTVSETYATKDALNDVDNKFNDYSTTTEMNSVINQKANEITSTVSKTYATKTSVTDLSNNLTNNYSTTTSMNSAINQKANEITSTVSSTYATKNELTGEITSVNNKISSVEQTAEKIGWVVQGNSSSSMTMTDEMLSIITKQVKITGNMIVDGTITASEISSNAITSDKINAGSVTTEKLSVGAVTADKISSNAITTDKLNANAVTTNKISSNAITSDKINASAVTADKIAAGSINADKIAGKELVGVTLRNADSTFTVDGNGNITGASITSSVGDNWQIDQSGNMEVKDLSVEGVLTCKGIAIEDIQSPKYPSTLDADIRLYVNSLTGDDSYTLDEILESYDESEEQGSDNLIKKFYSLRGVESALPKNLNGKTVRIYLETNDNGQILFRNFMGGEILIFLCSHEVKGYIGDYNCYCDFKIYGGSDQNKPTTYGVIRPSVNTVYTRSNSSVFFQKSPVCGAYYCNIYGASSDSGYSAIKIEEDCMCRVDNCNFYSAYIFVNASSIAQVYCATTTGLATGYGFAAYSGSTIHLANTTQANGKKRNAYWSNASVIFGSLRQTIDGKDNITWDSSSNVIENNTTTTPTTTNTVTYKSNYGDTYRSSVYNNWKKDNTCRQGDYGYGDCTGVWFFGTQFSELKGKTIKSVKITIRRQSGGSSSAVTHKLWMHNYSSRPSGAPTLNSGWSQTFSLATGDSTTITITNSTVLNAIKAGTCKGFAIRHTYSSGYYSVCSGSATVKITYEE